MRQTYEAQLRVCVEMMEGFRHTLHITARWAPDFSGDARDETEDDDAMEVDEVQGCDINVSAAFSISAV
jgi:hypothetical protein